MAQAETRAAEPTFVLSVLPDASEADQQHLMLYTIWDQIISTVLFCHLIHY